MIRINDLLKHNFRIKNDKRLYCLIGQAQDGKVHFCNLANAPHILVGGCTDSGKSMLLHNMILSLAKRYSPKEVGLVLLDPKETEFSVYHNLPHLLYKERTVQFCLNQLEEKLNEQKTTEQKIVVVIDEYSILADKEKQIVEKLVRLGHGVGIHVILATQRVANVSSVIKACAQTVIACKVADEIESLALLGETGAELLSEKGEILYRSQHQKNRRFTSGYASKEDIKNIVEKVKMKCIEKGDLMDGTHICPVCGKTVFSSQSSYEICSICGWEDEGGCEEYPDEESGPNHCSLNEYRRRFFQRVQENPNYSWTKEMDEKWGRNRIN